MSLFKPCRSLWTSLPRLFGTVGCSQRQRYRWRRQWGATANTARFYMTLKPLEERKTSADYVIARLRPKLARVPGASLLYRSRRMSVGGHSSSALYQFVMRRDDTQDLYFWSSMLRG